MAYVFVTYVLWMFLGWFGIHHLYLRRPYHALTWFMTFGGVFGLGWVRDFWRIPEYVERANCSKSYKTRYITAARIIQIGYLRLAGMMLLGLLGGIALVGLMPEYTSDSPLVLFQLYRLMSIFLLLTGSAIGVYIVANIGELYCPFTYAAGGALCALPWLLFQDTSLLMPALTSTGVCWYKGIRNRPLSHPMHIEPFKKCLTLYLAGAVLWVSVISFGFLCHAKITNSRGESVLVRDELYKFVKNVDWTSFQDGIHGAYRGFQYSFSSDSWEQAFEKGHMAFEESSSLRILGFTHQPTEQEITKKCRDMSGFYHPDKQKTPEEKESASEKFIQVQEACNVLKSLMSKKKQR